jgi:hypothetical protein
MLAALFRRRRLPAGRRPPLDREERVVAWAGVTGDEVLVVTNDGVWLPGAHPAPAEASSAAAGGRRIGWHEIHKATWSGRQLSLVASSVVSSTEGYDVVADRPAVVHTLLDPGPVPAQVRARVTKSIAYTQHHPPGVRVVARRVPGVDGLRWTVRYDPGVDPADPALPPTTAELVAYGKANVSGAVP